MRPPPIPRESPAPPSSGTAQLLAGAVMISFSAVFVKLASVGPTMSGFYRTLWGGLILAAWVLAKGGSLRPPAGAAKWIGLSGLFFALDLSFWHRSVFGVGPGLSTILANFQVFCLAGWGALVLGERTGPRLWSGVGLAMAGLYLLVGVDFGQLGPAYRLGVLQGLTTGLCYTVYILCLRRLQEVTGPKAATSNLALVSLVCAGLMGLEALWQGESFAIGDAATWVVLIAYGVVGQVVGWVLISRGLPRTPASRAGLLLLLQPTLAFTWDILFFGRPTDLGQALGAGATLVGIYLGTSRKK